MKTKEKRDRFGLDKMDAELVNDILPVGINFSKNQENQKNLLATLMYINGIDKKDENGFFYVDNKYLMKVLGITEKTLISNTNKLIEAGFIKRISGKKHHPSKYTVDYSKINTVDYSKTTKNYSQDKEQDKDIDKDKEQDKDIDKEKEIDKDKRYNNIINYIEKEKLKEKDLIEIIKIVEDRFNYNLIQNNTEKTKTAMDTNIELSTINERLNNSAKYSKKMMQTINELQLENNEMKQAIKELQVEVKELKAKLNQDASNQDSSISSKSTSTDETSTKKDKSDSKPSNESALSTTHNEEENSSEASKTASNQIVEGKATPKEEEKQTEGQKNDSTEVVEDVDVDEVMNDFADAVKQFEEQNGRCNESVLNTAKAFYLQDLDEKNASYRVRKEVENRINNYIKEYNEKTSRIEENTSSGTTTHQDEEKPTESKEMASTSISEDNATTSNDVDDSLDGIFLNEKASKKDESKPSNKGTDCTPIQNEDTKKDDSKEVKDLKMPKTVEGCFQRYLESVEDLTNPTKADLNWRKDCITQSCEKEEFDESFIQELKSKIDEYNEEKALKVEDSSKDEEDEAFREDTVSIQDKSSTTNEKPSSGITIPQDEEKPTEAQKMPSNGKELRYLDRKTGKQYATEAEAQNDGASPMFLYDTKSGRCVFSYTSSTITSNEQSGIVAHKEDLKPVEAKKMPSTSISDSYANAQKEIEDSNECDLVSEPSLAIAV